MTDPPRAVYDCMVFVQAVLRPERVHATRQLVYDGAVNLFVSPAILGELEDVLTRSKMRARFPALTTRRVTTSLEAVVAHSRQVVAVPHVFALPRDPKDEPYVDLAIAVEPCHPVTWNDRHLTYLMRQDTPEGIDFCSRYAGVSIVDPPTFVRAVREA